MTVIHIAKNYEIFYAGLIDSLQFFNASLIDYLSSMARGDIWGDIVILVVMIFHEFISFKEINLFFETE